MEEEFKFAVTIKKKSYFNNINEIDQTIALTFQCHYKDPVERNLTFLNESTDPRIGISWESAFCDRNLGEIYLETDFFCKAR